MRQIYISLLFQAKPHIKQRIEKEFAAYVSLT